MIISHFIPSGFEVALQDDGGTDGVDECFVLPRLLMQSGIDHGTMGQYGSETLVVVFDGYLWHGLPPSVHELFYARQVFAGHAVGLQGFADDNLPYILLSDIGLEKIEKR